MHHIVFLDQGTIGPSVTLRTPSFAHDFVSYDKTAADQVIERAKEATVLIVNKVKLPGETLAALPKLKMIAIAATGYDNVDIAWCRANGIAVANIRNYAINTVPEHTFALILALKRAIVGYRADVANGTWQKSGQFCFFTHPVEDLAGKRLGIIGEGTIGQSVAHLGRTFGMEPVFAAHKGVSGLGPLYTPFEEVLRTSHVLTLHSPLLPQTRNMIARPEFEMMDQKPILVNTARGGLVEENDLVDALERGLISGAGFDVATVEPPDPDHPLMKALKYPNFILTPHTAWASREARQTLIDQLIDNLENWVTGTPSNLLTD